MGDDFLSGALHIEQADFRAGHDSILLGCFARKVKDGGVMLDLGCGVGTPLMVYGLRHPNAQLCGLEINQRAAELAQMNLQHNGFGVRSRIIHADMWEKDTALSYASFDGVMINPPYWQGGKNAKNEGIRTAKFIQKDIENYIEVAIWALKESGWLSVVIPASKSLPVLLSMQKKLCCMTMLPIHSKAGMQARLLLLAGKKLSKPNGGDLTLLPQLIMHHDDGTPTSDARMVTEQGKLPIEIA